MNLQSFVLQPLAKGSPGDGIRGECTYAWSQSAHIDLQVSEGPREVRFTCVGKEFDKEYTMGLALRKLGKAAVENSMAAALRLHDLARARAVDEQRREIEKDEQIRSVR